MVKKDTDKRIGQLVGYIRVSTLDQNTSRQEEQLQGFNLDELFTDHASGKDTERPQLQAALKHLRKGDTLIVHSMDRLARNLDDLRRLVKEQTGKGIAVQFIKESLTFTGDDSPMSTLLLSMMGAFAEFERSLIKERQREGIAIAKKGGKYAGRKPTLNAEKVAELLAKDEANGQKNRAGLARELGISRETLYQYINKAKESPVTTKTD
ncbi:recombinase family protein [Sulfurirhabdus autotrophica]|uniref:DNA invertase Pin-like site-specific DNA recombinase n=1 Tax=Sulfurirhabdus autotrophica TaxID=1706046 RepID=A0A4R3Y3M1_9PROT|nr:recombinase family protein [Sulfurirhabdus autotrophica]TCV86320.1 DNA invertase Pin-like site-specific DNA recombinase [Sulfurirhabdus autotrophica]